MLKSNTRKIRSQRFQRALLAMGGNAKEIASRFNLPYRSVARWVKGKAVPGPRRLKELCDKLGWEYSSLFAKEVLEDHAFEREYLDFVSLNRRFLTVQTRDPLVAWSYVSVAGALVFNHLSACGLECRAIIAHHFGVRIEFVMPVLAKVVLEVGIVSGHGLVLSWVERDHCQAERMELSEAILDNVVRRLRLLAGEDAAKIFASP